MTYSLRKRIEELEELEALWRQYRFQDWASLLQAMAARIVDLEAELKDYRGHDKKVKDGRHKNKKD